MSTHDTTIEPHNPGSRYYWGPRLWRLLHLLAEHTHRPEIAHAWKGLLHKTALIMPCEKCRVHLTEYLTTHRISNISVYLWELHNAVNERNGLVHFTQEQLEMYNMSKEEASLEAKRIFNDIKVAWTPLYHVMNRSVIYEEWKTYLNAILQAI